MIDDHRSLNESDNGTITSADSEDTKYDFKITTLDKDQVLHIATMYNIPTNGPMFDRIDQINDHFKQHRPDHPRNSKGVLIFKPDIFQCLMNKKTF